MKFKSIVPRKIRKRINRFWRFNSYAELLRSNFKKHGVLLRAKDRDIYFAVSKNDILIDCGANVGDITSQMARTLGIVYAFEPDPYAFEILRKRFGRTKNVYVFNEGVCVEDGEMAFYMHRMTSKDPIDASVGSSFNENKNQRYKKIFVRCINFSKFIDELGRIVALVKMDIEGMEFDVIDVLISSGRIKKIKQMIVETHERQMPELIERKHSLSNHIKKENLDIDLGWK
ncbi:MAG: FkbM family methyltransferase [Candidatus Marinimicrobia bacterium]|nr:FkbM family methyltransferase [Candidatus Neomarinimicrobiota bacterium]